MGKYDDIAKKTTQKVNAELAAERDRLLGVDAAALAKIVPDEGDRKKLETLISKVKAATKDNELIQAYREFAAGATALGIQAVGEAFQIGKRLVL